MSINSNRLQSMTIHIHDTADLHLVTPTKLCKSLWLERAENAKLMSNGESMVCSNHAIHTLQEFISTLKI